MTAIAHGSTSLPAARRGGHADIRPAAPPLPPRPGAVTGAIIIQALILVPAVIALAGMLLSLPAGALELFASAIGLTVLNLLIGVALVVGLARRSVLAQRLVLLGAGWTVLSTFVSLPELLSMGSMGATLLALAWAGVRALQFRWLIRPASKLYFGLDCPACRSQRTRGASLLYGKLRCRDCDHEWLRGRRGVVDVGAFD